MSIQKFDLVIVGAGAIGLCFARSLASSGISIAILDKLKNERIESPLFDGRDTALTHTSIKILKELGVWARIPENAISGINQAHVKSGNSSYFLNFCDTKSKYPSELGYLVSNHIIRKAVYDEVKQFQNIKIITEIDVSSFEEENDHIILKLSDESILKTKLLVAADSRFSQIRQMMGIKCYKKDFEKTIIVGRIKHSTSHSHIAYEHFQYGKTIALLPLNNNSSSVVITIAHQHAKLIMQMDQATFSAYIQKNIQSSLGLVEVDSELHSYPLICTYAENFIANRFALIGDAAVGMHPVTAHGMNFGIKGQDTLSKQIISSLDLGIDIGSYWGLEKYQRIHRDTTKIFFHFTNIIATFFTYDIFPMKFFRNAALRIANNVAPVKNFIVDKLMN